METIYLTIRLDLDKDITEEEKEDLISELDYEFKSNTKWIEIIETEICWSDNELNYHY